MPEVFSASKKRGSRAKKSVRKVSARPGGSGVYRELKKIRGAHILSSFLMVPDKIKFETQEPEEKIILLLRQHPVVNLGWVLLTVVLVLAPSFWSLLPFEMLPVRFQIMSLVLWYLMVLAFVLEKFLNWYFNVYIVTDERVVDIDFYGLIYRNLSVTKINNIQDISFTQSGGPAAIFNYGDIYIQTAAESREFDFLRVPKPGRVVEILYQLLQEEEQEALEGRVR